MKDKRIVTMQDISCVGQCSLTVALPVISAFGIETAIIPSAVLSTHTGGFSGFTFRDLSEDIPLILKHWEKENIRFDAVYTGYLGNACQVDYALELKKRFVTDDAPLVVDPAMADNGKLYAGFDMAFVEKMRSLCSAADVVLPNITEAALLTGEEYRSDGLDEAYVEKLVDGLLNSGAQNVVLTGVSFDKALLGAAVYEKREGKIQYVFKQKQEGLWHGTGDLFASAFCGAYLKGKSMLDAAETACRFVVECIKNTVSCRQEHWYGVKFEKALAQLIEKNS
ncbi:MAG: pyridoxamine kinase [Clostridia bacterium]|nr:pyridoxamine kinase [Clostridia bacterium]